MSTSKRSRSSSTKTTTSTSNKNKKPKKTSTIKPTIVDQLTYMTDDEEDEMNQIVKQSEERAQKRQHEREQKQEQTQTATEEKKNTKEVKEVEEKASPGTIFVKQLKDRHPHHEVIFLESLSQSDDEDEDEEDEDEEKQRPPPTQAELDKPVRIILHESLIPSIDAARMELLRSIEGLDGLIMTWTRHCYTVLDLIQETLIRIEYILERQWEPTNAKAQTAFGVLLGITLAVTTYTFWYMDTDVDEQVREMIKELMQTTWNKLLKHTDKQLGFVESRTRTDLKRWLSKTHKQMIQDMDDICA